MRAPMIAAALLLGATGAWTVVLGAGVPARDDVAVVMVSLSLWVATVSAVTGMLLVRSRWARHLAMAVTGGHALVALMVPAGGWWSAAAIATASAALAIGSPWLDPHIRGRPPVSGPPTRALLVPLILVAVPLAIGLSGGGGVVGLATGLTALLAAFWFVRVLPGALLAVRVLWPLVAVALAWPLGWPAGFASAVLGLVVAILAWGAEVRAAVVRLETRGSVVPIPPELAPPEILDAARIDDRGRPR